MNFNPTMEDPTKTISGLDINYTIPKRKVEDSEAQADDADAPVPVLQDAYAACSVTQSYATAPVVPFNQKQNAAYVHKEQPKTAAGLTYRDSYMDSDQTLPKELTVMFQPLFCKLCNMQLSSSVVAKLHYNGKNHEKKVRKYLIEHSERTGEPLHKRARPESKKTENPEDSDPKYFHCDVCDLPLTGRLHAESHYMGKNHQRVLAGKKAPSGKGYYDETGKWVRTTSAKADKMGRDGFGQDFVVPKEVLPPTNGGGSSDASKLRCDICQVSVTSLQQIEMHYKGQKHKKKLKLLGLEMPEDEGNVSGSSEGVIPPKDNILSSVMNQQCINVQDLSVFRTPSGYFYCKLCNLSLNSSTQFTQHLNSKNHTKKLTQSNSANNC